MEHNNTTQQIFLKALAGVGLIVILMAAAWGGVKALSYAPQALTAVANAFTSIQSTLFSKEEIVLSVNTESTTVVHEDPFTLSFEHKDKRTDGSYSFFYECREGVHFEVLPSIGREEVAFCNTYLNFVNEGNVLELIPYSTRNATVAIPVAIIFRENGSNEVDQVGSLTLTIRNTKIASVTDPTTTTDGGTIVVNVPTTPPPTTGGGTLTPGDTTTGGYQFATTTRERFSDPNGKPDLKVTILNVGTISRVTNAFTATSSVLSSQRAAVTFQIENVGTKKVSGWRFNAVLPTSPRHIYSSTGQPELFPGDKIEFTLGFDSIIKDASTGIAEVIINADPTNSHFESNEDNNIKKAVFNVITQ